MIVRTLVISSIHASLEKVLTFIEAFGEEQNWPEDFAGRLMLAGCEAATNAMDHGNHFDPTKDVVMHLITNGREVEITVEDQGVGFDRASVANPLKQENLLNDSGRGLLIIEEMADEVVYEKNGRLVRLKFNV